jgi:hypothetical protein
MQLWRMAVWEHKGEASGCNERRSEERSGRLFWRGEFFFLEEGWCVEAEEKEGVL